MKGEDTLDRVTRLDRIARVGFAARALVYILLGWLAIATRSRAGEGQNAVFDTLRAMPLGGVLLVAVAIGLFAYGVYRLATGILDLDQHGHDLKGFAKRAGAIFSGLAHGMLGYTALQFLSAVHKSGDGDQRGQQAARTLLDLPLGAVLLGVVGLYFFATAASQAQEAWKAKFMRFIQSGAPRFTCTLGRIGHAARAIVFAGIGWSLIKSAWFEDEDQAVAIGGAIMALRSERVVYLGVAAGLIVFGLFGLILARYRIVPRVAVAEAAKRKFG